MNYVTTVSLLAGLWIDGAHQRDADLRPLTGADEEFLNSLAPLQPAQRTTLQLARCISRLGSLAKITDDVTRSLSLGDREALLLHILKLTFGDMLECVVNCPASVCGKKMDIDLRIADLILPPYSRPQQWYRTRIDDDGASYSVKFRLPTGADQELSAARAPSDLTSAIHLILCRCVQEIRTGDKKPVRGLPSVVESRLPAVMADLDPQAEIKLNLSCPECGLGFSTMLDTSSYLAQEISYRANALYREVHSLAVHHHWAEAEIMSLPVAKRRLYLGLIDEEKE